MILFQSVEILQPAQVFNKRENECDIKRKNADLLELDSPHEMKKFKIGTRKSTSSPFLHEMTPTKPESAFSLFAKSLRKQGKLIIKHIYIITLGVSIDLQNLQEKIRNNCKYLNSIFHILG